MRNKHTFSLIYIFLCTYILDAQAFFDIKSKLRLSSVYRTKIDSLYRSELWIKHADSNLDLKSRIEKKNRHIRIKHRIQYMPFKLNDLHVGIASIDIKRKKRVPML